MPEEIMKLYKQAGMSAEAPKGDHKGMHKSKAAHQCVIAYMKKGMNKDEAFKRCVGGLGKKAFVGKKAEE